MIESQRYVRKPLYVEAVRVTPENFLELTFWCGGSIRDAEGEIPKQDAIDPKTQKILVPVNKPRDESQTKAKVGDWILKNEKGFKVYTHKAFTNSFDIVAEEQGNDDPPPAAEPEPTDAPQPVEPTPTEPVTPEEGDQAETEPQQKAA